MIRFSRLTFIHTLAILTALLGGLLAIQRVQGHQQYGSNTATGWHVPWRAGTDQWRSGYGFATGTHVGSENYALDFSHGDGTPIHAITSGTIAQVNGSQCDTIGFGLNVQVSHAGGYYSRYSHLDQNFFGQGTNVVQGQYIARSGNSGNVDPAPISCSDSSGAHLHFSVYSQLNCTSSSCAVNPQANGKTLSGYTNFNTSEGALGHPHRSDNAGVGDVCNPAPGTSNQCTNASSLSSTYYASFVTAYNAGGGATSVGQPWNPCSGAGNTTTGACWWVHSWGNGVVQDFSGYSHGHGPGTGVIMQRNGVSVAYWVHGGIWQRYLSAGGGPGYLGYPICAEFAWASYMRQDFQYGFVAYNLNDGSSVDAPYSAYFPRIC